MSGKSDPIVEPKQDLEGAILKLDAILAEMEEGKLPLEQLISQYEAGVKLVKLCQEQLHKAEQRIQIVSREADGFFALKDYKTDDED